VTSLLALWNASLTLSAAAVLALLILLVARFSGGRSAEQRQRARKELTAILLSGGTGLALRTRMYRECAADLVAELAELVRGSDRERLLQNAVDLGVPDVLRRRLRSRVAQDRLSAAETLAMFPGEPQQWALAALDDRNRDVRLGAALALAHNHAAPGAAEVARKLGIGTRERSLLVVSLMRDLAETDTKGVEAILYDPELPDEAKLAATDALAASGMVENAPLVAWMADAARTDSQLQPRIFRALGRIGHPGARDAVLTGMQSAEWRVRSSAAEAAGRIGLTDAIPRLKELLGDEHWWVRLRCGEALARMGRAGREALLAVAESGSPQARHAASATLAERKLA
jgi:hypothetical protein